MKDDYFSRTSIHTRVNQKYRISSIWREYGNGYFDEWAWETFVWKREGSTERIDYQPKTCSSINEVFDIHKELYNKIISGAPFESDNSDAEPQEEE